MDTSETDEDSPPLDNAPQTEPAPAPPPPAAVAAEPAKRKPPERQRPRLAEAPATVEVVALPHDLEAERALIGAVMVSPDAFRAVRHTPARAFYASAHRELWRAFEGLDLAGSPFDPITLVDWLRRHDSLEVVGGYAYIAELLEGVPKASNAAHYAEIVRRHARRRLVIEMLPAVQRAATSPDPDEDVEIAIDQMAEAWVEARPQREFAAVSPWSPLVEPTTAAWLARDLLPSAGLAMVWAQPNAGKTYLLLRAVHELLAEEPPPTLWGHPDLHINREIRRVLWLATEETAGELRARAEMVQRGLGHIDAFGKAQPPARELIHIFAPDRHHPVSLLDLPAILDRYPGTDLVVLDSLTGLRPASIDGQKVKWDLDNDAASAVCSTLRGLAVERDCLMLLVHHTGRDVEKGYRGPTEYWARVDSMFGLVPDPLTGATKIKHEKSRNGRVLREFRLKPSWGLEGYRIEYQGEVVNEPDGGAESSILAYLQGAGMASQAEISKGAGVHKATASRACRALENKNLIERTGVQGPGGSPVYRIPAEGLDD